MIARPTMVCALALALSSGQALAEFLPLKPGAYVDAGTPCANASNADRRDYDGKGLNSSKAADCKGRILSRQGNLYQIEQDCQQFGADHLPRAVEHSTIRVDGPDRYTDRQGHEDETFRLCPDVKPY